MFWFHKAKIGGDQGKQSQARMLKTCASLIGLAGQDAAQQGQDA